jgi:hypothetical protein
MSALCHKRTFQEKNLTRRLPRSPAKYATATLLGQPSFGDGQRQNLQGVIPQATAIPALRRSNQLLLSIAQVQQAAPGDGCSRKRGCAEAATFHILCYERQLLPGSC